MSDLQDLMDCLGRHDLDAQQRIYERYHERVYRYVYVRLLRGGRPTTHMDDCVENGIGDAFIEFFERPDRFDPSHNRAHDPLLAYLSGMAYRRIVDCLRTLKPGLLRDGNADSYLEHFDLAAPPAEEGRLQDLIEDFLDRRIEAATLWEWITIIVDDAEIIERVSRLTDMRLFTVWLLKDLADFTLQNIAQFLGLTEDAVEKRLRRARDILRNDVNRAHHL